MYNASQRGRARPSFDPASPASHALVTRSPPSKRIRQKQHRRGSSSPTTACLRVALRECPPCYFRLVATRPATQMKCILRHAGSQMVLGSIGYSEGDYRFEPSDPRDQLPLSRAWDPDSRDYRRSAYVSPVPTFTLFSPANHPPNFPDHSVAPVAEILSILPHPHVSKPEGITPVRAPCLGRSPLDIDGETDYLGR